MKISKERRDYLFSKCADAFELSPEEIKEAALSFVQETHEFLKSCNYDDKLVLKEMNLKHDGAYRFFDVLQCNTENIVAAHRYFKDWLAFIILDKENYSENTIPTRQEVSERLLKEFYNKLES